MHRNHTKITETEQKMTTHVIIKASVNRMVTQE